VLIIIQYSVLVVRNVYTGNLVVLRVASSYAAQVATNVTLPGPRLFSRLGEGPSHLLCKQSVVMTVEAATTLLPCGGLCLEEVRHTGIKIAYSAVFDPVYQ